VNEDDDDNLGYGRPPPWSRFKPGVSGNPKGRPLKKRDVVTAAPSASAQDDSLRQQLQEPMAIRTAGGSQKIPRIEAILLAQQKAALEGNTNAQRDVIRSARELEERDRLRKDAAEWERRQTFYRDFRALRVRAWAEAERLGKEPDDPWPHPDDLILNERDHRWSLRGPGDERDVPFYRYVRAERDWHFSSMILGARRARTRAKRRLAVALHSFWACFDVMLPLRWQISGPGFDQLVTVFWLFPIADLKADVQRYDVERRVLKPLGFNAKHDRESYKIANDAMKPLLRRHGYRSLAHFEQAYETLGSEMHWPRGPKGG
jgi:hypothetical protein